MQANKILDLAERNQSLKEELVETFYLDTMSQLDGLHPTDDGDELLELIRAALDTTDEPNSTLLQLFTYLLGMSLDEWLEEFGTD